MVESVKQNLIEHSLYDFSLYHSYQMLGPFPNNIPRGGDKQIIHHL